MRSEVVNESITLENKYVLKKIRNDNNLDNSVINKVGSDGLYCEKQKIKYMLNLTENVVNFFSLLSDLEIQKSEQMHNLCTSLVLIFYVLESWYDFRRERECRLWC